MEVLAQNERTAASISDLVILTAVTSLTAERKKSYHKSSKLLILTPLAVLKFGTFMPGALSKFRKLSGRPP